MELYNIISINGIDIDDILNNAYYANYDTSKLMMYNLTGTISGLTTTFSNSLLMGNFDFIQNSLTMLTALNLTLNNFTGNTIKFNNHDNINNIYCCNVFSNNLILGSNISKPHLNISCQLFENNIMHNINNINMQVYTLSNNTINNIDTLSINCKSIVELFMSNSSFGHVCNIYCENILMQTTASNVHFKYMHNLNINGNVIYERPTIINITNANISTMYNINNITNLSIICSNLGGCLIGDVKNCNINADDLNGIFFADVDNINISSYMSSSVLNVLETTDYSTRNFILNSRIVYSNILVINMNANYLQNNLFIDCNNLNITCKNIECIITDNPEYCVFNHNKFNNIKNCNISVDYYNVTYDYLDGGMDRLTTISAGSTIINSSAFDTNTMFNYYQIFNNCYNLNLNIGSACGGLIIMNCNNVTLNISQPFVSDNYLSLIVYNVKKFVYNDITDSNFTYSFISIIR